ncbi:hypothetical protein MRB53_011383 [Persea americana]|uniref:Uncharacterized protein n=1 Tax=Persea americana TaxID=3435 RepID=A0ACC2LVK1_PERAE|nr:hypothetical protein MRB53_011383 [Persea americana]
MQEPAETNPAHRNQAEHPAQWNVVHRPALSLTRFIGDAHLDATLPRTRTVPCPRCNGREAVYYEDISRVREKDSMVLSYNCCNPNCLYEWRRH